MCSLHFENNLLTIEGVRFASISKKTPLSKLSFAFVSLALPLLAGRQEKREGECRREKDREVRRKKGKGGGGGTCAEDKRDKR